LAISNNCVIVGATEGGRGAAYLYGDPNNPPTGREYTELAILSASNGASDDLFGESVAIDGDIVVVGATGASGLSASSGAAYVFRILGKKKNRAISISEVIKLTASNGATSDRFGQTIAIHGDFILVGATEVKQDNLNDVGSVYLFVNSSTGPTSAHQWTQLQILKLLDDNIFAKFGVSLAMDDNIAVIGTFSTNAAYVVEPVESSSLMSSWTQVAKLSGGLGGPLAVAGNWIVMGVPFDNTKGTNAGAVQLFSKTSSSWTQTHKLLANDGAAKDFFGSCRVHIQRWIYHCGWC
jgi:hypothetical protein